jgi:hypothetical protein
MENLSPSRIQPLSPGEEKDRELERPRKPEKPLAARPNAAATPVLEAENAEKHKLDELA